MRKRFHRTLSIRGTNFRACSASDKMWTVFTCNSMLSISGTNFIAGWAYTEWISSLAEHTRKFLKVEYLGWIEYDFQKSPVTGPSDHRVSVSAKKFFLSSSLCTFNLWSGGQYPDWRPEVLKILFYHVARGWPQAGYYLHTTGVSFVVFSCDWQPSYSTVLIYMPGLLFSIAPSSLMRQ